MEIPVGRYDLQISKEGYKTIVYQEVLLSSSKEVILEVSLNRESTQIEGINIVKTINKALSYQKLLQQEEKQSIENIVQEVIFVQSDRKKYKVNLKDVLFVEALKDYVIFQFHEKRIITKHSLKALEDILPKNMFFRINRSFIVNLDHIDSFNNNDIFIQSHEITIGNSFRDEFFKEFVDKTRPIN